MLDDQGDNSIILLFITNVGLFVRKKRVENPSFYLWSPFFLLRMNFLYFYKLLYYIHISHYQSFLLYPLFCHFFLSSVTKFFIFSLSFSHFAQQPDGSHNKFFNFLFYFVYKGIAELAIKYYFITHSI
jgi:hypothetical protein